MIGRLMMDWRISQGLAGWSEIGRELAPDWQHSYFIVQMFFTDWHRIDIELADWSWIANGLVKVSQMEWRLIINLLSEMSSVKTLRSVPIVHLFPV